MAAAQPGPPCSGVVSEAPHGRDVGLLLAGDALAAVHKSASASDRALHRLHEWYLRHLCFGDSNNATREARPVTETPKNAYRHAQEVDFHAAAFDATPHSFITKRGGPSQPACAEDAAAGDPPSVAAKRTATTALADLYNEDDDGLSVLLELLDLVSSVGGAVLALSVCDHLLSALQGPASDPFHVDVALLSSLFTTADVDSSALWAVGSATSSYRVWACVAWHSASFSHQTALTELVSGWCVPLQRAREQLVQMSQASARPKAKGEPRLSSTACSEVSPVAPVPSVSSSMLPSSSRAGAVQLQQSYALLRRVMEGLSALRVHGDSTSIRSLFSHASSSENEVAKLLMMQGPGLSRTLTRGDVDHQGTAATLFHITTGMLLYVQFHLSLHALGAARQCAQMAVLVGHQIHSDELLALAHYSQFLVHVASGCPAEAADSLSVAMHLSSSSPHSSGVQAGAEVPFAPLGTATTQSSLHTGSLCYLGAAQLLLMFPASVGVALRAAMTTSALLAAMEKRSRGEEDSMPVRDLYDPAVAPAHLSAQTTASCVQHALWLSEVETLYRPSPSQHWLDLVTGISRETTRMMGSVYGIASAPQTFSAAAMKKLYQQVDEELRVAAPGTVSGPHRALLAEMTRHTAYKALVSHEGYLHLYPETSPGRVLAEFREAVRSLHGTVALEQVVLDEFFGGVTRYLHACDLARRGFMAAAYNAQTDLFVHLCQLAGLEQWTCSHGDGLRAAGHNEAGAVVPRTCAGLAASQPDVHGGPDWEVLRFFSGPDGAPAAGGVYWSADRLFLLSHVQLQRVHLATYLDDTCALSDMAGALEALSLRCHFSFGVLCARLISARALAARGHDSDACDQLTRLESACARIGLEGLLTKVRRQRVCATVHMEKWPDALRLLEQLAKTSCPPLSGAEQLWVFTVRLHVVCRLVGASEPVPSQRQPAADSRGDGDPTPLTILRRGVEELSRHPLVCAPEVCPDDEDTVGGTLSLTESIQVLSTFIRASLVAGQTVTDAVADRLQGLLVGLHERQLDTSPRAEAIVKGGRGPPSGVASR